MITHCHEMVGSLQQAWGPMDHWPCLFIGDLEEIQHGFNVHEWLDRLKGGVFAGENILSYLGHVVESELPKNVDELRDVWRQTDQLTRMVSCGVGRLRHTLDIILMDHPTLK